MTIENSPAEGPDELGQPSASGRRRLFKSALATPVVLSSLTSRPVLGGQHTGCTVSGQMSAATGTAASHSPEPETCVVGLPGSQWTAAVSWPVIKKGKLPKDDCKLKSSDEGTVFNGFAGLQNAFYRKAQDGKCVLSRWPGTLNKPATMLEVLNSTDTDLKTKLGRSVVISLLNAYQFSQAYPVKPEAIVQMFNAAYANQNYYISSVGSAYWTPAQVLQYLESLYPPS